MEENQKLEILKLYLEGESHERIVKRFGLNPGQVTEVLNEIRRKLPRHARNDLADICVFPALRRYIEENQLNRRELYRMLYVIPRNQEIPGNCSAAINSRVMGKCPFSSAEWLRLAELTGIPLERLMDSEGKVKLGKRR